MVDVARVSPKDSVPALAVPSWTHADRVARPPVRVAEGKATPGQAGATPKPEAVRELLDRIASGKSSLTFDLAVFKVNPALSGTDVDKAAQERSKAVQLQYNAYIEQLAKTPAGFQLLSHLAASNHKTTIEINYKTSSNHVKSDGKEHTNGRGEPATVLINPSLTKYHERVVEPWMSDRPRYSFYHELVHAWHVTHGTQATGADDEGVPHSESQAVGVGKYAKAPMSENVIRRQLGAPERTSYRPTS